MGDAGGGSHGIEVEWQFDAIDLRPVERWLSGLRAQSESIDGSGVGSALVALAKPTKRLVDTYLDTTDWRVGRAGYVLRVRRSAGVGEVTLKDSTSANAGLRRRVEITELLPTDGVDALGTTGPVGRRLRALAGTRPLRQVIEVRTTRRPFDLERADEHVAEVALDDTVINVGEGERPTRLRRVEVEVDTDWVDRMRPVVESLRGACGLQPATLSKFEAGLLAAGLKVPGAPDVGSTVVNAGSSVGDLAYAVLRKNFVAMTLHESGTRLGEDPEELHDMRVATRRLRAALSLFKEALPVRAQHLRDEIGWLGRELGAVRDLDVQLEKLVSWAGEVPREDHRALEGLSLLLEKERDAVRAELLSALESTRYERLLSAMAALLRQGPSRRSPAARAPAAAVVPDLVEKRQRAASKAARRAKKSRKAEDFHDLRIRSKRLRYSAEFVSEIYDGQTARFVRRVTRLQDLLGAMQDATVAVTRLHTLATAETSALSAATVFAMGAMAQRYRQEANQIAKGLPERLDDLAGREWQALKALMERRRVELGALYRWTLQPRRVERAATEPRGTTSEPSPG